MPSVHELASAEPLGAGSVLAATDRTFITAIPVLIACLVFGMPTEPGAWLIVALLGLALLGVLSIGRRAGRFPGRGTAYTLAALGIAITALWELGPMLSIGVVFGLAVLFAGALLSQRALVGVVTTSVAVIALAVYVSRPGVPTKLEISAGLWIAIAIACGFMLWMATRVLSALVSSLEDSYTRAADAYRNETAARTHLDNTQLELDELEHVELVGRLAAGVAHDVNNALAGILAATDVLSEEVSTPEQRRHLAELEAASHHAADLVRDLMWIGRKFPASSTAIADLGASMRACLERLERVARSVAIDVTIDPAARIAMPPEHLEQVLFALILGTHRAGGSRLALSSASIDDFLEITLRGTAATVREDSLPRAIRARLGILAAKELVTQYSGTLTASVGASDEGGGPASGQASEVSVVLRLPRASGAERTLAQRRAARCTALVVDDEPMILRRLCQLVARRGYTVTSASTVAEGLAALEQNPSLLVTDIQLPDGSGEQIAAASYARDPHRPIVVCSGYGADDALHGRLRSACITFLQKPFTVEQLADAVPLADAYVAGQAKGGPT